MAFAAQESMRALTLSSGEVAQSRGGAQSAFQELIEKTEGVIARQADLIVILEEENAVLRSALQQRDVTFTAEKSALQERIALLEAQLKRK
jgi:hypothetical protein